jgi:hypothetical protein
MASCARLREVVQAAAEEVGHLRRTEQAARRLVRRAAAVSEPLTRRRRVIVAIAVELGCEDALLGILVRQLVLLQREGRRPFSVASARAEVVRVRADDHLRGCALGALGGSPDATLVFGSALRVAELRAAVWLRRANAAGVAASRAQLLTAFRRGWPPAALGMRAERFLDALKERPLFARRVAQQFRRRFHVTWRRMAARGDVPEALAQQRAAPSAKKCALGEPKKRKTG